MRSLILVFILISSSVCFSQRWEPLSRTPAKFQAYYSKFRAAVKRSDKDAVALLTAFPFERNYGSDAESYQRSNFIERYDEMFGKSAVFADSDPTVFEFKSGYIVVFESAGSDNHYLFKPVPTGYAFYALKPEVTIKLASADAEFQAFYTKLRSAVSGGSSSVAALAQFPFKSTVSSYNSDSDTTNYSTTELSRPDFLRKMKFRLSDFPKAPEFIVHANGRFSTLCENYSDDDSCAVPYFFERIGDTYKLTETITEK